MVIAIQSLLAAFDTISRWRGGEGTLEVSKDACTSVLGVQSHRPLSPSRYHDRNRKAFMGPEMLLRLGLSFVNLAGEVRHDCRGFGILEVTKDGCTSWSPSRHQTPAQHPLRTPSSDTRRDLSIAASVPAFMASAAVWPCQSESLKSLATAACKQVKGYDNLRKTAVQFAKKAAPWPLSIASLELLVQAFEAKNVLGGRGGAKTLLRDIVVKPGPAIWHAVEERCVFRKEAVEDVAREVFDGTYRGSRGPYDKAAVRTLCQV